MMNNSTPKYPTQGLVSLVAVCFIWGSTYLAIRLAVREESGFPPFFMVATRTAAAAFLLGLFVRIRKQKLWPSRQDWKVLVPAGLLLWIGGNGLVTWALEKADSGFAALSVGTLPLWAAVVESIVFKRKRSLGLVLALMVGFGGLVVLHWNALGSATDTPVPRMVALIFAPLCWAIGSVLQTRFPVSVSTAAGAAWLQVVGCVGFFILSFVVGESNISPTPVAWAAWGYLVVVGGMVGFTAYIVALKTLPFTLASTYAYVNPIIAVFLGVIFLKEPFGWATVVSSAMILVGVAGVFRSREDKAVNVDSKNS